MSDRDLDENVASADGQGDKATRRRILKLGAAMVPAAITLHGGAAWAASTSCQIHIPAIGPNDFDENNQSTASQNSDNLQLLAEQWVYGQDLKDGTVQLHPAQLRYLAQLTDGDPGFSCIQSVMLFAEEP